MPTAITLLQTLLHGRLVGRDSLHNRYYQDKNPKKNRRWVIYNKKPEDASLITPAWHAWMHHTTNIPPSQSPTPRLQHAWQKPHQPNLTGTAKSRRSTKKQSPKPYEAWTPPAR